MANPAERDYMAEIRRFEQDEQHALALDAASVRLGFACCLPSVASLVCLLLQARRLAVGFVLHHIMSPIMMMDRDGHTSISMQIDAHTSRYHRHILTEITDSSVTDRRRQDRAHALACSAPRRRRRITTIRPDSVKIPTPMTMTKRPPPRLPRRYDSVSLAARRRPSWVG